MRRYLIVPTCLVAAMLAGCASQAERSPDVTNNIRKSLDGAGADFKDVSVSQDRDKGVVTLKGQVPNDADKTQAESIAKSDAGGQVVANEIEVVPAAASSEAKAIDSDVDKGIRNNLDAALRKNALQKDVSYTVEAGVVTLTGTVNSEAKRASAEKVASGVPNVQQVVNDLEVKNQKATATRK